MRITTSKSKNSESFYITKGYINDKGVSTSTVIRKLGTLNELLKDHRLTRDDVMAWAKEEARLETLKYKEEQKINLFRSLSMRTGSWSIISKIFSKAVICFHSLSTMNYN